MSAWSYSHPQDVCASLHTLLNHDHPHTSYTSESNGEGDGGDGDDGSSSRNTVFFTVVSDDSHQHASYSLPYWLHYCNATELVSTAVMRPFSFSTLDGPNLDISNYTTTSSTSSGSQSLCTVLYTHLSPSHLKAGGGEGERREEEEEMFCIEDFLQTLLLSRSNPSSPMINLRYLPSAVLYPITGKMSSIALEIRRINTFMEIRAVLLALENIIHRSSSIPFNFQVDFLSSRLSSSSQSIKSTGNESQSTEISSLPGVKETIDNKTQRLWYILQEINNIIVDKEMMSLTFFNMILIYYLHY
eukprot:scaffold2831_cov249-Ochromonas_danica.AAC.10